MVNPSVTLTKGLTIIGIVCLLCRPIPASGAVEPKDLWNESLEYFKSEKPQEACRSLKEWVSDQKTKHIESAEAFFNLSLCSWKSKQPADSVIYAIHGLRLRSSPLKRWSDLKLLQVLQKEIGIRDNLPVRESFIIKMLFPTSTVPLIALLGFWVLILTLSLRKYRTRLYPLSVAIISSCCLLAFIIFIFQKTGGPIAVISDKNEISLVSFDKNGTTQELAVLPPGTILELGVTKNEFTQVLKPIGGWIKTESLETVIP